MFSTFIHTYLSCTMLLSFLYLIIVDDDLDVDYLVWPQVSVLYIYICYGTNWNPVGSGILLVQIRIPISTRTNQDIQICTRRILDPTKLSVGFRILLNLKLSTILDTTELKNIKTCKICEIWNKSCAII